MVELGTERKIETASLQRIEVSLAKTRSDTDRAPQIARHAEVGER